MDNVRLKQQVIASAREGHFFDEDEDAPDFSAFLASTAFLLHLREVRSMVRRFIGLVWTHDSGRVSGAVFLSIVSLPVDAAVTIWRSIELLIFADRL